MCYLYTKAVYWYRPRDSNPDLPLMHEMNPFSIAIQHLILNYWSARQDLNLRSMPYQDTALASKLLAEIGDPTGFRPPT